MGQMNVIPASPTQSEKKMDPMPGFQPIKEDDAAWEKDSAAPNCNDCASSFGVLTRRHHCRVCGKLFCDRCSPKRHLYHNNRACMKCTSNAITATRERLLKEYTSPKHKQS